MYKHQIIKCVVASIPIKRDGVDSKKTSGLKVP